MSLAAAQPIRKDRKDKIFCEPLCDPLGENKIQLSAANHQEQTCDSGEAGKLSEANPPEPTAKACEKKPQEISDGHKKAKQGIEEKAKPAGPGFKPGFSALR